MIIRGGRNIDINEVEAALAAIPGVAQVCVVPVPDDLLGERAAALIVSTGPALALADVRRHLEGADSPSSSGRSSSTPSRPSRRTGSGS